MTVLGFNSGSTPEGAYQIVNDAYSTSKLYANDMFNFAVAQLDSLAGISVDVVPIEYTPSIDDIITPVSNYVAPDIDPSEYTFAVTDNTGNPVVRTVDDITLNTPLPVPSDFFNDPPTIDFIPKPDPLVATAPELDNPPIYVPAPVAEDYVIPPAPTLRDIDIPDALVFQPVIFDDIAPELNVIIPDTTITFSEDLYTSDLAESYTSKLMDDIVNGTAGLHPDVEQALWDRARAREDKNSLAAKDEALTSFSKRGFTMPPGAIAAALAQAAREVTGIASTLSRDIMIKQADMAVDNAKFAITAAVQAEGQLITYTGFMAQRAFDLAKANAELLIQAFKLRIEKFNTEMQGYVSKAQVFKQRIDAEVARAQFRQTELEGLKLIGELNVQDVSVYEAELRGVQTLVDVYKSEVQAYSAYNEAEKIKVEVFDTEVRAFGAVVSAKTEEYRAYSTQIEAELTKVQGFTAQVGAYTAAVEGYKAAATAEVAVQSGSIAGAEADIASYELKIRKYIAQLDAESKRIDSIAKKDTARIGASAAEAGLDEAEMRASTAAQQASSEISISNAKGAVASASVTAQIALQAAQLESNILSTSAKVAGQLAAAALTVTTTSAQLGYTSSNTASNGYSLNDSYASSFPNAEGNATPPSRPGIPSSAGR